MKIIARKYAMFSIGRRAALAILTMMLTTLFTPKHKHK